MHRGASFGVDTTIHPKESHKMFEKAVALEEKGSTLNEQCYVEMLF